MRALYTSSQLGSWPAGSDPTVTPRVDATLRLTGLALRASRTSILQMVRLERFELPTFQFVAGRSDSAEL